jgi:hypothetical protein
MLSARRIRGADRGPCNPHEEFAVLDIRFSVDTGTSRFTRVFMKEKTTTKIWKNDHSDSVYPESFRAKKFFEPYLKKCPFPFSALDKSRIFARNKF